MRRIPAHIPSSTYRLQFGAHLSFEQAASLVSYLSQLGIGDAYASPLFRSRESSSHGYDVIDHSQIDPDLGDESQFVAFAEALRAEQMGLMLDVVPNHMGIDDYHNVWWQDVLENGPSSTYARFFDIDWQPPKEELKHKVLLPILGDQYGRVLETQEIQLVYDDQRLQITCYGRRFPLSPRSWKDVLQTALQELNGQLPDDDLDRMELESIIVELENLPLQTETDPERIVQRYREKEVAKRRLSQLLERSQPIAESLNRAIALINGRRGDASSFDQLEKLLAQQAYRLCYWRVATDEINYRRFFDINELAAIRVEDPEVFEAVHQLVFRFIDAGWVTSLRIDHPDGLLDPQQYFENLQENYRRLKHAGSHDELAPQPELYIAVEKILAHDEELNADWPVAGTTGYEFLNLVNGLFVRPQGVGILRRVYARFIDENLRFADVQYEAKRLILNVSMSSELHVLAGQLDRISEQHRFTRDFTRTSLRRALREVISCFPVYRTYIRPESNSVSEEDRRRVVMAIRTAKRRNPALSPSFFDFIGSVLLLEDPDGLTEEQLQERRQFVLKFQQVTGPVTAKGLEDTTFYRYYPLASLNEVGGEPASLGTSLEQFHRKHRERLAAWPYAQLTTATHDTKRGEDLRARLNVLSEMPEEWERHIQRWQALNEPHRVELEGAAAPDPNEEYLLYQTIVGTWPVDELSRRRKDEYVQRIVQYMDKALKEAKSHTSWLSPNEEYDEAVANFVRNILDEQRNSPFVAEVDAVAREIASAGFVNSLAQTLIKLCAPGLPDFYQGTELWDFSLVDPDNRRPVDFELRQKLLGELQSVADDLPALAGRLVAAWPDARIKMLLIWRALSFRKQRLELFQRGNYVPLTVEGAREEHVCAFAREHEGRYALVVVPRFTLGAWRSLDESLASARSSGSSAPKSYEWPLAGWFAETTLRVPIEVASELCHVLTGQWVNAGKTDGPHRLLDLAEVLRGFPVALLEG